MKFCIMFISIFIILSSTVSNAAINFDDYPVFVETCYEDGLEKLLEKAEAINGTLDLDSVSIDSIDSRWWNPSKYIWYAGNVEIASQGVDTKKKIVALVQFYVFSGACR